MTLWRHISVNCVSQMVAANQIRVFQQEPLRKNLGQLAIAWPLDWSANQRTGLGKADLSYWSSNGSIVDWTSSSK